ncbi:hypothetical protein V1514DRAFT_26045 [Lipomyces japonicus]|uniref:uncharacterized protein n=1 Tax=Lipomyces japonicus TaxID=56871 RepID=UPI0034CD22E6
MMSLSRQDFDFLPDLLDLLERVSAGTLAPKDVSNEAGRIRIKLSRTREALKTELDEDVSDLDEQMKIIDRLRKAISAKKVVLEKIGDVGKRVIEGEEITQDALKPTLNLANDEIQKGQTSITDNHVTTEDVEMEDAESSISETKY